MAESTFQSRHPVTYTLRCEHCQNSSTHPLVEWAKSAGFAQVAEQMQHYAEHHSKCKPE